MVEQLTSDLWDQGFESSCRPALLKNGGKSQTGSGLTDGDEDGSTSMNENVDQIIVDQPEVVEVEVGETEVDEFDCKKTDYGCCPDQGPML